MKNTKKLITIYLIALFVFISAAVTLRSVALFNSFNWGTMHFDGSVTFTVSAIISFIAVLGFSSFIFLAPKKYKLTPDCSALEIFIPSGILSVAFIFMSVSMLIGWFTRTPQKLTGIAQIVSYIPVLLTILAVLSAAFSFLSIMSLKRICNFKAALGMCAIAFLALYGTYLFFAKDSHPTNSPNKIIDQLAYFSSAIFMLFETRIALGRDMWKPYVSLGLSSAILCAYSSLPALILYFANGATISDSITESVLTFTIFVYVSVKLLLTLKLPSDDCCKMASAIQQMATKREEELAEKRMAAHAHEYNIMEENSITDDTASDGDAQTTEPTEGQISFDLNSSEG